MGLASGLDVRSGAFPALVVSERGSDFVVEAELPGMKLDDIELLVMGDELTIKGERKEPSLAGAREHRRERAFGTFYRAIRLPVEVEADAVKASLENGVLTVTLPKAKAALPRKIEVKAASR
jgi:HSP20 family protein